MRGRFARAVAGAAALTLVASASAPAHDHGEGYNWSPETGGPRLGFPAYEVLRHAPDPGPAPPRKLDLLRGTRAMTAADRRALDGLATGRAGGRAIAHRAGELVRFQGAPRAEQLSTGFTAGEPTMGVAADGTLFYVGIGFGQFGSAESFVLRSRDAGKTWQQLDVLIEGSAVENQTLDPMLYLDKDTGRVFNADLILPCTPISWTDDQGDSWDESVICNHTDHQNVFTGPPPEGAEEPSGYPNVVYYCSIDGGLLGAYGTFTGCSRSMDGGRIWQRTLGIPYQDEPGREGGSLGIPGHCTGATGHGAVGPDGTVFLPRGWCGQPYVAISRDMGDSWERVQVADNGFSTGVELEEHEANVAIDRDGNVYYTWVAVDRLPYLAVSRDGGRTWGEPIMIAPPGVNEAWDPFVDVGDPGRLALIYMGTTNSPGPPYCVATTFNSCTTADGGEPRPPAEYQDTTWNGYMAVTVNALDPNPTFLTTTVNDPADPLIRGTCGPLRCQQEFDFLDVIVGPDGTAWASFVDGCSADPAEQCPLTGIGIVGRLVGGPPLIGPLPPPAQQLPSVQPACRPRGTVRLRVPRGLKRVRVTVAGRRVRARARRGRVVIRIPATATGRVAVRITGRKSSGRRFRRTRMVRACRS